MCGSAACSARTLTPISAAMSDTVIERLALSRMNCSAFRRMRGVGSRISRCNHRCNCCAGDAAERRACTRPATGADEAHDDPAAPRCRPLAGIWLQLASRSSVNGRKSKRTGEHRAGVQASASRRSPAGWCRGRIDVCVKSRSKWMRVSFSAQNSSVWPALHVAD